MIDKIFHLPEDFDEYRKCALWCNATQKGKLIKYGDGYKCIKVPQEPEQRHEARKWRFAVTEYLNDIARQKDYDSVESCVTYRYSDNEQWRKEADAMAIFRDAVWTKFYTLEGKYTKQELLRELPTIQW